MKAIDGRFRSVLFAAFAGALLVSSTAAALPDTAAAAQRGKAPTVAEAKAFYLEALLPRPLLLYVLSTWAD